MCCIYSRKTGGDPSSFMREVEEDPRVSMPSYSVCSEKLSKGSFLKGSLGECGKGKVVLQEVDEYKYTSGMGKAPTYLSATPLMNSDSVHAVTLSFVSNSPSQITHKMQPGHHFHLRGDLFQNIFQRHIRLQVQLWGDVSTWHVSD